MTNRVKRFGDAMKHAMTRMPNDPIELIHFFENLETLLQIFEVPDDLTSTLLRPYLNNRARHLLARFDPVHNADCCTKFHLSPQVYFERFNKSMRANDDTYFLSCSQLRALLQYFVKSGKIN
jgi:hypothetical protein